jgi:hypothetical protein
LTLKKNNLIFIVFFIVLFVLHYYETLHLGPLKVSQIWKFPIVAIFIAYYTTYPIKIPLYITSLILYSVKQLLSSDVASYPLEAISECLLFLVIPATYCFLSALKNKREYNADIIFNKLYYLLVLFVIFSTLPFALHFLEPISEGYSLAILGLDENGLVGVFQKPHNLSILHIVSYA